jgi:inner membrane protease subunit 2
LNPDTSTYKDLVLFDRFSIRFLGDLQRGDIVTFPSPLNPGRPLVKRIIALEGDAVRTLPPYPVSEVLVPFGHVWVEGQVVLPS